MVGSVFLEIRKCLNTSLQNALFFTLGCISGADELLYNILQLLAKEYRNNSWRRLVSSQSVIVSRIGCGLTKQICVNINGFQNAA